MISSIAPSTVLAGSAATTVTVTGTGFTPSTVIQLGEVSEPTTYVSSTQLTAVILTNQLAAGTAAIVASNGGANVSTGSVSLQINNPVPAVTQISPSTFTAGSASASITVTGTGFVDGSNVQVDGTPRQTAFVNGTQLTAVLTAADLAAAATHSITVVNVAPGGGASTAAMLPITNLVPTITSLTPRAWWLARPQTPSR